MNTYKDVEYRQLERDSDTPDTRRLKRVVIVLVVICVGLLCFTMYAFAFRGANGGNVPGVQKPGGGTPADAGPVSPADEYVGAKSDPPTTASTAHDNPQRVTTQRSTQTMEVIQTTHGSITGETNTSISINTPKGQTSTTNPRMAEITHRVNEHHSNVSTGIINLGVNSNKGISDTKVTHPRFTSAHKAARPRLNRELLLKRLREVIDNLRTGKEDRLSMQVSLMFLQQALRQMDRKGSGPIGGSSRGDATPTPRVLQTLDNPSVRRMMESLTLSPHQLDVFDFSKHPQHDFRCVLLKLHLLPDPLVCVNDPELDAEVSKPLAVSGTWEDGMVKHFMGILKSDSRLQAVDLGSNLGVYSLAAASLNRPVLAVESNIRRILPFHKSVKINGFEKKITLVTNSLSDHYKLVQLVYNETNLSHTNSVEITEWMLRNDIIHAEDVSRTVTLNDLLPAMTSTMAVLRVDLHGDEAVVFRAASTFFSAVDVRYVITHWWYSRDREGHDFVASFLSTRTYTPYFPLTANEIDSNDLRTDHAMVVWIKGR